MKKTILNLMLVLVSLVGLRAQSEFVDTTFGKDGLVVQDSGNFLVFSNQVTAQAEIFVGGGEQFGNDYRPFIKKFSPMGQVEPTFGIQGTLWLNDLAGLPDLTGVVNGTKVVEGDKILCMIEAIVEGKQQIVFMKIDISGSLDTAFGINGVFKYLNSEHDIFIPWNFGVSDFGDIYIQALGASVPTGAVIKVNPTGQLDSTYGRSGLSRIVPQNNGQAFSFGTFNNISVYPDGSAIVIGNVLRAGNTDVLVYKLTPQGQLDTLFGTHGFSILDFSSRNEFALDILQKDNAIFLCGNESTQDGISFLVKLDNTGQLVQDFGDQGLVIIPRDSLHFFTRFLKSYGQNILVGGVFTDESNLRRRMGLWAFNENGLQQDIFSGIDSKSIIIDDGVSSLRWGGLSIDGNSRLLVTGFAESPDLNLLMTRLTSPNLVLSARSNNLFERSIIQNVYPNPATDLIHLKLNKDLQFGRMTLRLINSLGQVLRESVWEINSKDQELVIPIDNLNLGIHYIQLYNTQNQRVGFVKFVKK